MPRIYIPLLLIAAFAFCACSGGKEISKDRANLLKDLLEIDEDLFSETALLAHANDIPGIEANKNTVSDALSDELLKRNIAITDINIRSVGKTLDSVNFDISRKEGAPILVILVLLETDADGTVTIGRTNKK